MRRGVFQCRNGRPALLLPRMRIGEGRIDDRIFRRLRKSSRRGFGGRTPAERVLAAPLVIESVSLGRSGRRADGSQRTVQQYAAVGIGHHPRFRREPEMPAPHDLPRGIRKRDDGIALRGACRRKEDAAFSGISSASNSVFVSSAVSLSVSPFWGTDGVTLSGGLPAIRLRR